MIKKRLTLLPSVRNEECHHEYWHWTGSIPCTGRYVCHMCGYDEAEVVLDDGALLWKVGVEADRWCSREPGSLGDRLIRLCLEAVVGEGLTKGLKIKMENILKEASSFEMVTR